MFDIAMQGLMRMFEIVGEAAAIRPSRHPRPLDERLKRRDRNRRRTKIAARSRKINYARAKGIQL